MLELLAWALLILVLLRALVSLEQIYSLLRPDAPSPPPLSGVPRVLLRKAALTLKGAVYLVLSRDKVSSSALRRTIDPAELEPSRVTREAAPLPAPPRRGLPRGAAAPDAARRARPQVRLIFVRHGESVWNLVFNRGADAPETLTACHFPPAATCLSPLRDALRLPLGHACALTFLLFTPCLCLPARPPPPRPLPESRLWPLLPVAPSLDAAARAARCRTSPQISPDLPRSPQISPDLERLDAGPRSLPPEDHSRGRALNWTLSSLPPYSYPVQTHGTKQSSSQMTDD